MALEYYKKAEDLLVKNANNAKDSTLLGYVYSKTADIQGENIYSNKEATYSYHKALGSFRSVGDKSRELSTLRSLGICYFDSDNDSSLFYFNKAVSLAKEINNLDELYFNSSVILYIYFANKENTRVVSEAKRLIKEYPTDVYEYHLYVVLARTYAQLNNKDKALYYYNRYLEASEQNLIKTDISLELDIKYILKEYDAAIQLAFDYCNAVVDAVEKSSASKGIELEKKYNYQRVMMEKEMLNRELKMRTAMIILSSLLLVSIITILLLKQKNIKHRNTLLENNTKVTKRINKILLTLNDSVNSISNIIDISFKEYISKNQSPEEIAQMTALSKAIQKNIKKDMRNNLAELLKDESFQNEIKEFNFSDKAIQKVIIYILNKDGVDNKSIAKILGVSDEVVRVTLSNILKNNN